MDLQFRPLSTAALVALVILVAGCTEAPGGGAEATVVDPDGTWWVDADVTSCYSATGGNTITVVDGVFDKTLLYTYEVDGLQQSVSVEGSMEWGGNTMWVEGNMWVEGDACDGGNGFGGWLSDGVTEGSAYSNWGRLHFTKQ